MWPWNKKNKEISMWDDLKVSSKAILLLISYKLVIKEAFGTYLIEEAEKHMKGDKRKKLDMKDLSKEISIERKCHF